MMGLDAMRVRAVVRKELRDFRRKRSIVVTMCILPLLFLVEPVITIFLVTPSTSGAALQKSLILPILYLLLIPTIMPSTLSAYSVVGEREQGTLEPLLTTPIREQEFLVGKARPVARPGPGGRCQPKDHGHRKQDERHDPAGPGDVPEDGRVHRVASGHPPRVKTSPSWRTRRTA